MSKGSGSDNNPAFDPADFEDAGVPLQDQSVPDNAFDEDYWNVTAQDGRTTIDPTQLQETAASVEDLTAYENAFNEDYLNLTGGDRQQSYPGDYYDVANPATNPLWSEDISPSQPSQFVDDYINLGQTTSDQTAQTAANDSNWFGQAINIVGEFVEFASDQSNSTKPDHDTDEDHQKQDVPTKDEAIREEGWIVGAKPADQIRRMAFHLLVPLMGDSTAADMLLSPEERHQVHFGDETGVWSMAEVLLGRPMAKPDRLNLARELYTQLPEDFPNRFEASIGIALRGSDRSSLEDRASKAYEREHPDESARERYWNEVTYTESGTRRHKDLARAREQWYFDAGPTLRSLGGTLGYAISWAFGLDKYKQMQGAQIGDTVLAIIGAFADTLVHRHERREILEEQPLLEVPGTRAPLETDKRAPPVPRESDPPRDLPKWWIKK